jgi:hypothetical protein
MARLAQTAGLSEFQTEILAVVRTFVDKEIIPNATALEHADEFPDAIVDGMKQMMDGIEVGRVNVAARACGMSIRAFELAVAYAQQRRTFGKPIAEHQAIAFKLAEMATKVEAAHLLMVNAAWLKDSGERNDVEAGMAKLLASEYCAEVTQEAFRIHGGYGYSREYEIERLMREAPFLLIGEGTSEIQKTIISRGRPGEGAATVQGSPRVRCRRRGGRARQWLRPARGRGSEAPSRRPDSNQGGVLARSPR